jgi:hypothetical protein
LSFDGSQIAVIAKRGCGVSPYTQAGAADAGAARSIFTSPAPLFAVRLYPAGDALLLTISENRQHNFFRLELAGRRAFSLRAERRLAAAF